MLKKPRPSSKHISLLRLLNKLKDDDFVSHTFYNHGLSLSSIYLSHPGFHGPHISTQPLLPSLAQVCLSCRMDFVSASSPSPQRHNSHLLTTYLHPLYPQISKAGAPSPWSLPWLACECTLIAAVSDACHADCLCHTVNSSSHTALHYPRVSWVLQSSSAHSDEHFLEERHSLVESFTAHWGGQRGGQRPSFVDRYLHGNPRHIFYLHVTLPRGLVSPCTCSLICKMGNIVIFLPLRLLGGF